MMEESKTMGSKPESDISQTPRNPFVWNFCRVLVERKGEEREPQALERLLNDMYRLYENMLGQNMVKALPEDARREYLALCEDLSKLDYEKIGEIFGKNIPDYKVIMKETMKEFAAIYMKNREFDPKDYPVSQDFHPTAAFFDDEQEE